MTDNRDIVLRLREPESHYDDIPRHEDCVLMEEAADEIERLRVEVDRLRSGLLIVSTSLRKPGC